MDGVVLTPRLAGLPVLFVVFLIHLVPLIVMQPILFSSWKDLGRQSPKVLLSLFVVSATGGLIGTVAIVKALFLVQFNMLSVVVLLQKLQPVFAIFLAALILKERVTLSFLSKAGIALAGAYLMIFGFHAPHFDGGSQLPLAAALSLLAAVSFGAATTLGKLLINSVDVRTATFGRYAVTTVLALAACLVTLGTHLPFAEVSVRQWLFIIIIGMTSGTTAIVLYYWGLQHIRATVATICELCLPLSAVVLDYFVNGTVLTGVQWLGAALLLSAIVHISLRGVQENGRGRIETSADSPA